MKKQQNRKCIDEALKEYGRGQQEGIAVERERIVEKLNEMKKEPLNNVDWEQAYAEHRITGYNTALTEAIRVVEGGEA